MRLHVLALLCLPLTLSAQAQWDLQASHTNASLRGIHNVGGGVAWASGTNGTVLRTEDGGYLWQTCAVPPGAEKLDFRGIQGLDENTAIVMSSGKGDLSRLYKTTDGCRTWKLLFTNPDKEGFWDGIIGVPRPQSDYSGSILGDPVEGSFTYLTALESTNNIFTSKLIREKTLPGSMEQHWKAPLPSPLPGESSFAASNSSLISLPIGGLAFATGGAVPKPRVIGSYCYLMGDFVECHLKNSSVPMATGPSGGIFSLAYREILENCPSKEELAKPIPEGSPSLGPRCESRTILVAVGGDYTKPDRNIGTAAHAEQSFKTLRDSEDRWIAAQTPPHGYRSAVAYDEKSKTWITVGPNGTDISTDDGKNWRTLKPKPGQPTDADKNWSALSLPFVVGPNGRIGKLRDDALKP